MKIWLLSRYYDSSPSLGIVLDIPCLCNYFERKWSIKSQEMLCPYLFWLPIRLFTVLLYHYQISILEGINVVSELILAEISASYDQVSVSTFFAQSQLVLVLTSSKCLSLYEYWSPYPRNLSVSMSFSFDIQPISQPRWVSVSVLSLRLTHFKSQSLHWDTNLFCVWVL